MSKLSIITINYNNAVGLKLTLDSVASHAYQEFEHIIIDGGSTDGSMEIIREYESIISNRKSIILKWVSEKDNGIYDAMNKGVEIASGIRVVNALNRSELVEDKNKGVSKASGEYVYFLNSGDSLASKDTIQEMIDTLDGSDFVIGRVNKTCQGRIVGQTDLLKEEDMSLYQMFLRGINHQAALIKRPLLVTTPYDVNVRLSADWKFFVETIVLGGAAVKFVDMIFANYDVSGVSSDTTKLRQEREKIMLDILPKRIARDYLTIAPHYYEVIRVQWLLKHPFWYKLYRGMTTLGRKIMSV